MQQLPITPGQESEQPDSPPVLSPYLPKSACGRIRRRQPPNTVPPIVAKHLCVAAKALVPAVTGEHHLTDLTRRAANGKRREHRDVTERLVVVINQLIENR